MSIRMALLGALEQGGLIRDPRYLPGDTKFVLTNCPFAEWTHKNGTDRHPSMSIRVGDTDQGWFSCFACKEQGPLWELFRFIDALAGRKGWEQIADDLLDFGEKSVSARLKAAGEAFELREPVPAPDMSALERWYVDNMSNSPEIDSYLKSRGVMPELAIPTFLLSWDTHERRVLFPMFNLKDEFVGLTGRAVDPKTRKQHKNYWGSSTAACLGRPLVDDGGVIKPNGKYTLLVEGQVDLMRTFENLLLAEQLETFYPVCTFNADCGAGQIAELELLGMPVICMYDNDPAGHDGWAKLKKEAEPVVPALRRVLPPEDIDPGELAGEELMEVLMELT